jgi:Flp pilus assembly protein protease CpaA
MCVSASLCFLYDFSLVLFLLFVLFCFGLLAFFVLLLSRGKHVQNILNEQLILNKKIKKKQNKTKKHCQDPESQGPLDVSSDPD